VIAEFESLKPGGNRAEWFGNGLENFHENYPIVTSIIFFHYSSDVSTAYKDVSWYHKDDEKVTNEIKKNESLGSKNKTTSYRITLSSFLIYPFCYNF
jgi:hypothetical protein